MHAEGIDRFGPAAGPVTILVHGAVVNRATMAPLARMLASTSRVWVPDLPGHGELRRQRFTLAAALDRLAGLVAQAHDAPVVVAGDSLGGYLALALAARLGARIGGVVAGGCSFPMRGAAAVGAAVSDLPLRALTALAGESNAAALILRAFVAAGGDRDVSCATAALGLRPAARTESIAALRLFDLRAAIRAVACPIVFINGARDVPIVWFDRAYARSARQGRAVRVAGSGHAVMTFAPRRVANEIESLWRERSAGAA